MFEITVIILIWLRMNDDRIIDAGAFHAFEQMVRRRRLFRTIRRSLVIRETLVITPGEAVKMRVDDQAALRELRGVYSVDADYKCRASADERPTGDRVIHVFPLVHVGRVQRSQLPTIRVVPSQTKMIPKMTRPISPICGAFSATATTAPH